MGVIISLVGLYCRTHILRGRCSCAFGLCEFGAVDVAVAVDILLVGVVADAEGDSGDGVDVESKEPDRGRVKIVIPVF